jgi:hypothetical protein
MAETDDPKDDKLVTLGFLKRVLGAVGRAVGQELAPANARLEALEKRIAALEQRSTDAR